MITHTSDLRELLPLSGAKVWWLASWYPSRTDPWNGDFVQRHAFAVAKTIPLLVIHAIHDPGLDVPVRFEWEREGQLEQLRVYFRHSGSVSSISDKLRYNRLYYRYTRRLIDHLLKVCGPPTCLHVHIAMKMGRLALWAERKYSIPVLVSEQSSGYFPGALDGFDRRSFYYRHSVRQLLRKAKGISNVSEAGAKILADLAGRSADQVAVIRNLADPALFCFRRQETKIFTFLHVSTWKDEQNNVSGMLRAFERLAGKGSEFRLRMVGGGPEQLSSLAGKNYGKWLQLEGTISHEQVAERMEEANCLVLFSNHENFPCVIVEALCSGLPVITTDAGGCAEAIDAANGLVVARGNEDQLTDALQVVMERYQHFDRAAIADAASAQYGTDKIAGDFLAFYDRCLIRY